MVDQKVMASWGREETVWKRLHLIGRISTSACGTFPAASVFGRSATRAPSASSSSLPQLPEFSTPTTSRPPSSSRPSTKTSWRQARTKATFYRSATMSLFREACSIWKCPSVLELYCISGAPSLGWPLDRDISQIGGCLVSLSKTNSSKIATRKV